MASRAAGLAIREINRLRKQTKQSAVGTYSDLSEAWIQMRFDSSSCSTDILDAVPVSSSIVYLFYRFKIREKVVKRVKESKESRSNVEYLIQEQYQILDDLCDAFHAKYDVSCCKTFLHSFFCMISRSVWPTREHNKLRSARFGLLRCTKTIH